MRRLITALALVALAACQHDDRPRTGSVWKVDTIAGVAFTAGATITFDRDDHIFGQAPCNSFAGSLTGVWPDIRLERFRATLTACAQLPAEAAFFAALGTVRHAEMIEGRLILSSGAAIVLELSPQD